ncbi:hypothetical protein BDU57DRAFT_168621 [Ampelomyces quisqualis]|uniref:Uncharacterized protein n=1 Tax=Ampelomyces quisqualis TaxID=50730 RepID=A0A6A5QSD5_AMPQU|nr:hypothetical protein BDU57DRAFT_168621 [Ampelomyces quisqualis]
MLHQGRAHEMPSRAALSRSGDARLNRLPRGMYVSTKASSTAPAQRRRRASPACWGGNGVSGRWLWCMRPAARRADAAEAHQAASTRPVPGFDLLSSVGGPRGGRAESCGETRGARDTPSPPRHAPRTDSTWAVRGPVCILSPSRAMQPGSRRPTVTTNRVCEGGLWSRLYMVYGCNMDARLLHGVSCRRVAVCDTLARLDSKQACLRNVVVCLFYPAASPFGDAPRTVNETPPPAASSQQPAAPGRQRPPGSRPPMFNPRLHPHTSRLPLS